MTLDDAGTAVPPEDRLPPSAAAAVGRALAVHPDDGLVLLRAVRDADGEVVDFRHEWLNAAAERNAGRPLVGQTLLDAYGEDATLFADMRDVVGTGQWRQADLVYGTESVDPRLHRRTFSMFLADAGDDTVVCQYRDLTALRQAQARLQHQAGHDELTGVANRRSVREGLEAELRDLPAEGPYLLLILADLDRFKEVNDVHGHATGDEILRLVAHRMRSAARASDLVARYGGDEFVVVCRGVADEAEASQLADRLRTAVTGRYAVVDGSVEVEIEVGLSIGACLVRDPMSADDLLRRADRALYRAKGERTTP